MQLAIEGGPRSIYVGDIKHLLIGATWEAGTDRLPNERMCSIAAREIFGVTGFFLPVPAAEGGSNVIAGISEAEKLGLPFHASAKESIQNPGGRLRSH